MSWHAGDATWSLPCYCPTNAKTDSRVPHRTVQRSICIITAGSSSETDDCCMVVGIQFESHHTRLQHVNTFGEQSIGQFPA
jgi:hypothetical protein